MTERPANLHGSRPEACTADDPFAEERASLGAPSQAISLDTIQASVFASREIPQRPWLVRDFIPDRVVTLLSGDGGAGKSLLALQLAVAVATGTDWIGSLPEAGRVLYLAAEDDVDEIHRRLHDIVKARGIDLADLGDLHICPLAGKDAVLGAPDRFGAISATPLWHAVREKVASIRPRLLIVDNNADAYAGNENVRSEVRQFVGLLRSGAIDFHMAILLLTHPSLTGLSTGTGAGGSTAWSNSARSRLFLEGVKAEEGEQPDADLRVLKVKKSNYASAGQEVRFRWQAGCFKLEGTGPGMFDRAAADAKAETKFLALLDVMSMQERPVSPNPGSTYAPAVFAKHPDAGGFRNRAFANAMERLLSAGRLKVETFGPPSKLRHLLIRAG